MQLALRRCPFCGQQDARFLENELNDFARIECFNCGASGPPFDTSSDNYPTMDSAKLGAADHWNTRH